MKPIFDDSQRATVAKTVVQWLQAMEPVEHERHGPFAMLGRGDRARLRRSQTPQDVLLQSAFHRLLQELERQHIRLQADALALVAGTLVHARHVPAKEFAPTLGRLNAAGRPALSELRFRQLQTCRDEESFYRQVRRALQLIAGEVDVGHLALDLLQWVWEVRCPTSDLPPIRRLRLRWAADYFHAALRNADQAPA